MSSTQTPEPLFRPLGPDDPRRLGDFQVRARLGAGGMGRVYLGATSTGRRLAIKVVRSELAEDPEFRTRFRREIDAAQRVRGLYTAAVVDADADSERPWLATEYVPGPSLAAAVAAHGALPETTVRTLVAGVAEALYAVHRAGLVHRDLKPSNVLLGPEGPCVIDFGIARAADATPLTRTGYPVGTPVFMAPEQVRGEHAGTAADVWALGALALYAATAEKPFGDGPESAVLYRVVHEEPRLDGCPAYLRDLVVACLDKHPGRRPSLSAILEQFPAPGRGGGWLPERLGRAVARYAETPAHPMVASTPGSPLSAMPPPIPPSPHPSPSRPPSPPPSPAPVAAAAPPAPGADPTTRRPKRGRRRVLAIGLLSFLAVLIAGGIAALVVHRLQDDSGGPGGASTSGDAPDPGTYRLDRRITTVGGWELVLTDMVVRSDGTMAAHVRYHNEDASDPGLACWTGNAPDADSVEYADGTVVKSTQTYCSEHPNAQWDVARGKSWTAYAVFPSPTSGQSFTLHWQPDDVPSGDVTGITLR